MIEPSDNYPLRWPEGVPRTHPNARMYRSRFGHAPFGRRVRELVEELDRVGASHVVISTNWRPRLDGMPLASQRRPDDEGVAVYFRVAGEPRVLAADQYQYSEDNFRAITLTLEALRAVVRHGVVDVDRVFTGFAAIQPPAPRRPWWEVLGYGRRDGLTEDEVRERFRDLAKTRHPDVGGSAAAFQELQEARAEALRVVRV